MGRCTELTLDEERGLDLEPLDREQRRLGSEGEA